MPPGSIEQKNGPPFHRPNRNANGVAGRLLLRNAWFDMVWQRRTLLVNAAIEGYYRSQDFVVNDRRSYSITATLRLQEIEGYGYSDARLPPPGQGNGFIWRLHGIVRYEERDGGLYFEMEAIALTRDIPASLRWLASPLVNHLSIDSLTTSLRQTRDAVSAVAGRPARIVSCSDASRNSGKAQATAGN
jgi:hypothetical protein